MTENLKRKAVDYLVVALAVAHVALILLSWLVTAAWPDVPMHSMLSSEGIRWLFGTFTRNQLTPVLAWMLTGSMAYGALRASGLLTARRPWSYRQRSAMRFVAVEAVLALVLMVILTAVPHAVLLSVTGQLFPSSFSDSIIPTACLTLTTMALTYGFTTNTLRTLDDAVSSLTAGIAQTGRLWLVYVLSAELYAMLRFTFA